MPERSQRIQISDEDKLEKINAKTKKLFKKYRMDMELRELSPSTIYNYESDLKQWATYIYDYQCNQSVTDLNEDDLTEFYYFCKVNGNNSRRMKRRMASISAFYKYLVKKRVIDVSPMTFIDRPKKDMDVQVQTFLTKEQVDLMREKLLENVNAGKRWARDIRAYALLSLSTMARVNAISNIRWEQINLEDRVIDDVLEKEGKIVTLYFSEEVKDALIDLKKHRKMNGVDDGGYLFFSDRRKEKERKPITNGTLRDWCKKIGEMIDVPTLHPHDFRHSGAQLLKLAGCPIDYISEMLHHESIDVTKKFYLRQDKKKIKKLKDKYMF